MMVYNSKRYGDWEDLFNALLVENGLSIKPIDTASISIVKRKPKPTLPNGLGINRVIYNDPATIVLWNDGTKTIAKAEHGDKFNKEFGFSVCLLKKLMGNRKYHDFMNEYVYKECEE